MLKETRLPELPDRIYAPEGWEIFPPRKTEEGEEITGKLKIEWNGRRREFEARAVAGVRRQRRMGEVESPDGMGMRTQTRVELDPSVLSEEERAQVREAEEKAARLLAEYRAADAAYERECEATKAARDRQIEEASCEAEKMVLKKLRGEVSFAYSQKVSGGEWAWLGVEGEHEARLNWILVFQDGSAILEGRTPSDEEALRYGVLGETVYRWVRDYKKARNITVEEVLSREDFYCAEVR